MLETGLYIPSIDAKDIYLASHYTDSDLKEYTLKLKNGQYNLRKFINTLDYSLDLIELVEIYKRKYRRNDFAFKIKKHMYTTNVVNVTFKYSVKEWNQMNKNTFVKYGYDYRELIFDDCIAFNAQGEIVGVQVGVKIDNVPTNLPRCFCVAQITLKDKTPQMQLKKQKEPKTLITNMVKSITNGLINCHCSKCHSLAQWGIDTFGNDFLEKYWDYEKNVINPYDLSSSNHTKYIWIKCQNTNYHGSYKTKAVDLTRTSGIITCPYCYNTRVHKLDSLGHLYPDIIHLWSDKNTKSPYEYKPKSGQKAWFKCGCGKHSDTYRTICNAHHNDFECPDCVKERNESKLEECVRKYINNVLGYKTLHEHKCTITAINPNTRRPLPYDNEITSLKLIIEVHGIQHYVITNFANMAAKSFGTTPEYELSYLQWKDSYKKDFALKSGYYYLEIPYWAAKNDYYKIMIDDKIKEILKEAA